MLYPALYASVNIDGTLCLLELSRKYQVRQFVFASSSSVYGQYNRVPFCEDDSISKPLSVYAATKAAGEMLAFTYSHIYSLPVICLRIFTVFSVLDNAPAWQSANLPSLFKRERNCRFLVTAV